LIPHVSMCRVDSEAGQTTRYTLTFQPHGTHRSSNIDVCTAFGIVSNLIYLAWILAALRSRPAVVARTVSNATTFKHGCCLLKHDLTHS